MPLPVVAVHRSFSQHIGSEILRRRLRRLDDFPIRLAHADIFDLQLLGRRGVSENQLAESFHARLALDPDHRLGLRHLRAVVFKADTIQDSLKDRGLFSVGVLRFLLRRSGAGACAQASAVVEPMIKQANKQTRKLQTNLTRTHDPR